MRFNEQKMLFSFFFSLQSILHGPGEWSILICTQGSLGLDLKSQSLDHELFALLVWPATTKMLTIFGKIQDGIQ